jgi:hypothetical protein
MKIYTDLSGQPLKVGDNVVYSKSKISKLLIGQIVRETLLTFIIGNVYFSPISLKKEVDSLDIRYVAKEHSKTDLLKIKI